MKLLHLTEFSTNHKVSDRPLFIFADKIIAMWPHTHKRLLRDAAGNPRANVTEEGERVIWHDHEGTVIQYGVGTTEETGTFSVLETINTILSFIPESP